MSEFINTIDKYGEDAVMDMLIERTIDEFKDNIITTIGDYAFYGCTALTELDIPNTTVIRSYAFYGCTALTELDIPNVTNIHGWAFQKCENLVSINLPNLVSKGEYVFRECTKLRSVNLPKLTSAHMLFYGCNSLEYLDLPSVTDIGNYALPGSLKVLILRSSNMAGIGKYEAMSKSNNCWIYVPRALVDSYKADANWALYTNQFRALEDYTVDGTVTGALDESKI